MNNTGKDRVKRRENGTNRLGRKKYLWKEEPTREIDNRPATKSSSGIYHMGEPFNTFYAKLGLEHYSNLKKKLEKIKNSSSGAIEKGTDEYELALDYFSSPMGYALVEMSVEQDTGSEYTTLAHAGNINVKPNEFRQDVMSYRVRNVSELYDLPDVDITEHDFDFKTSLHNKGQSRLSKSRMEKEYEKYSDYVCTLMSREQKKSLCWMTGNGTKHINKYLIDGEIPDDSKCVGRGRILNENNIKLTIDTLDSAFSELSREDEVVVYRGLNMGVLSRYVSESRVEVDRNNLEDSYLKVFKEGDIIHFSGYSSTSVDPSVADRFSTDVILEMKTSEVIPVGGVSIHGTSEMEMLMDRDLKFSIESVREEKVQTPGDRFNQRVFVQLQQVD